MPSRSSGPSRTRRTRGRFKGLVLRVPRTLWLVVGALLFLITLALVGVLSYYWVLFGKRIDERLHGERERVLPRVYARPLELYRGQALGEPQLVDRLNDLGYAERGRVEKAGEFTIGRDAIVLIPRDGDHKGAIVRAPFDDAEAPGLGSTTGGCQPRWRAFEPYGRRITFDRVTLDPPLLTALISTAAKSAGRCRSRRSRRAWCRRCSRSRTGASTTTWRRHRSGRSGARRDEPARREALSGRRQHAHPAAGARTSS